MYISNDREGVLNLVTYIQWEKPQVMEYDKICNGLKALSEILSIYSYIINRFIIKLTVIFVTLLSKYMYTIFYHCNISHETHTLIFTHS